MMNEQPPQQNEPVVTPPVEQPSPEPQPNPTPETNQTETPQKSHSKKPFVISLIIILFLALLGAGTYVEQKVGKNMIVANVDLLLETQPEIIPGMELPKLGTMPEIEDIETWLNIGGLANESLKGKVTLIDFMTYSCVNCIRTWPQLNAWNDKYKASGLQIVGIHTPEFEFEKDVQEVRRAIRKADITFPVGLDNNYTTWKNFDNRFWPATYIFDREGDLRYTHFGEGKYEETERVIQQLLDITDEDLAAIEAAKTDFSKIKSPETYFGYGRGERFVGPIEPQLDERALYEQSEILPLNTWDLEGSWIIHKQFSEVETGPASFRYHFNAGKANLVLAHKTKKQTKVDVYLDGEYVTPEYAGRDVVIDSTTGRSFVVVEFPQLYELISGPPGQHILEIESLDGGIEVYSITFGTEEE